MNEEMIVSLQEIKEGLERMIGNVHFFSQLTEENVPDFVLKASKPKELESIKNLGCKALFNLYMYAGLLESEDSWSRKIDIKSESSVNISMWDDNVQDLLLNNLRTDHPTRSELLNLKETRMIWISFYDIARIYSVYMDTSSGDVNYSNMVLN